MSDVFVEKRVQSGKLASHVLIAGDPKNPPLMLIHGAGPGAMYQHQRRILGIARNQHMARKLARLHAFLDEYVTHWITPVVYVGARRMGRRAIGLKLVAATD